MVSESTFVKGITRLPLEIQDALKLKSGYKLRWTVLDDVGAVIITCKPPTKDELIAMIQAKKRGS